MFIRVKKNLSGQAQFRSKEISKASVMWVITHETMSEYADKSVYVISDDMVHNNHLLYPRGKDGQPQGQPDHTVVIKYVPAVGDDKRA